MSEKRMAAWADGVCKTCGAYTHSCKCEHPKSALDKFFESTSAQEASSSSIQGAMASGALSTRSASLPPSDIRGILGNIIDHWELTANDIKSDPGMERLNDAIRAALTALESDTPVSSTATDVPEGMWYFSFYCEDRDSVQRVRVGADAPREFTCGVTGIAKATGSASKPT